MPTILASRNGRRQQLYERPKQSSARKRRGSKSSRNSVRRNSNIQLRCLQPVT